MPPHRAPDRPKAVLFDLYETLVTHFDPNWTPPKRTIADRLGVSERVWAESWRPLQLAWEVGAIESYPHALIQLCKTADVNPNAELLSQLHAERAQRTRQPFAKIERAISEVLAELRLQDIRLAVVTNASDLDTEPWLDCALAAHVDCFVASHAVRLLKPDPRIYLTACERLGVEPHEAIFIGDGGSGELEGAGKAGVAAFWASWFIDRWPAGTKPNRFPGDEWREHPDRYPSPFPRLRHPSDVLQILRPA